MPIRAASIEKGKDEVNFRVILSMKQQLQTLQDEYLLMPEGDDKERTMEKISEMETTLRQTANAATKQTKTKKKTKKANKQRPLS